MIGSSLIAIVGSGGHALIMEEACRAAGYTPIGFIDIKVGVACSKTKLPIVGNDGSAAELLKEGVSNVCIATAGDVALRKRLIKYYERIGFRIPTIVNSPSYVSSSATIGEGVALLPGCCINPFARIGKHCVINTGAVVEHEVDIGDYSVISPHVVLLGGSSMGKGCFVGSNSTVFPGVRLKDHCVIGAGSVVRHDVAEGDVVVGVPAKTLDRSSVVNRCVE